MWLEHREAQDELGSPGGPENCQVRLPKMCDKTPAFSQSAFNTVVSVSSEKRAFRERYMQEDSGRSGSGAPLKGVPLLAQRNASLKMEFRTP